MKKRLLMVSVFILAGTFFLNLPDASAETITKSDQQRYIAFAQDMKKAIFPQENLQAGAITLSAIVQPGQLSSVKNEQGYRFGSSLFNDFFVRDISKINSIYSSK